MRSCRTSTTYFACSIFPIRMALSGSTTTLVASFSCFIAPSSMLWLITSKRLVVTNTSSNAAIIVDRMYGQLVACT